MNRMLLKKAFPTVRIVGCSVFVAWDRRSTRRHVHTGLSRFGLTSTSQLGDAGFPRLQKH